MKITIEVNAKDRLEALLAWIEKRSEDKAHENNADVIADFVEKFLVYELKRLDSNEELIPQDIIIPDDVLAQPLIDMKEKIIQGFDEFLVDKGIVQPGAPPQSGGNNPSTVSQTATAPPAPPATDPTPKPRNGNGHKTGFVRKLNDHEKDIIREDFMRLNGCYEDKVKSCTLLLPMLGSEITVFQVTGFVSYLHREVASGRINMPDMDAYIEFMKKHKELWAQYNSPKYQKLRTQNMLLAASTPKFRTGTFKKKVA